jgi:SNF2 family DNA or RNA helicase
MLILTQTLDMLEKLCDLHGMKHLRIDGSTDVRARTAIVDRFNSADPEDTCTFEVVMLLSILISLL